MLVEMVTNGLFGLFNLLVQQGELGLQMCLDGAGLDRLRQAVLGLLVGRGQIVQVADQGLQLADFSAYLLDCIANEPEPHVRASALHEAYQRLQPKVQWVHSRIRIDPAIRLLTTQVARTSPTGSDI